RKYRTAFATAAAFATLLLAAAVVSTWLAVWALRAEGVAEVRRARAEQSEANARHNLYIANINRVRFELENHNTARARALVDLYRQPEHQDEDPRGWEWYYWDRMCQGELHTLKGHQGRVTAVAFSPDGSRLASAGGSDESTIKVWDTITGEELWTQT